MSSFAAGFVVAGAVVVCLALINSFNSVVSTLEKVLVAISLVSLFSALVC